MTDRMMLNEQAITYGWEYTSYGPGVDYRSNVLGVPITVLITYTPEGEFRQADARAQGGNMPKRLDRSETLHFLYRYGTK